MSHIFNDVDEEPKHRVKRQLFTKHELLFMKLAVHIHQMTDEVNFTFCPSPFIQFYCFALLLHMRRCFRDKSCATSLARCWLIKPISSTLEWLLWGNMASLHLSLLPLILYVDYFLSNKCCQWQRHECRESWMHTLEHQLIRGFSVTASVTDLICVPFLRRRICKLNLR